MTTMLTRNETANWLLEHDRYAIVTHRRPDGDTLGSAAALCRILRAQGKQAHVLHNPELTARYAHLLQGLTKPEPEAEDTLVCVDVASPGMLPRELAPLAERIALRIDHHGSATSFTPEALVDSAAGACGEIIYDILMEMWMDLDRETATALYVAVSTDTGCFRFSNTTDHSFLVAAACAAAGAPVYTLNQQLFETNSLARLRIQGWIAENTRFFREGRLALCAIPASVEQALGAGEDDLDNIASFTRTIEGVCMAATLRQTADGGTKASLRAVPGYDAAAVCARFGGGGHKGAAGVTLAMGLEEAAAALEQAMLELCPES